MRELSSAEVWVVVSAAVLLLMIVYASARVCGKAGFSRWLGIFSIIPVANVFLLFYLAFKQWPTKRRF
jgi:hypothetical protein